MQRKLSSNVWLIQISKGPPRCRERSHLHPSHSQLVLIQFEDIVDTSTYLFTTHQFCISTGMRPITFYLEKFPLYAAHCPYQMAYAGLSHFLLITMVLPSSHLQNLSYHQLCATLCPGTIVLAPACTRPLLVSVGAFLPSRSMPFPAGHVPI